MNHKALSIQQPHAWEISDGPKRIENRTWNTNHRGHIWIHAGKNKSRDPEFIKSLDMPLGMVVAHARLFDCRKVGDVDRHNEVVDGHRQKMFAEGPFCFFLDEVVKLAHPVPCKGALSFFFLPPDVEAQCNKELEMAKDPKAKKTSAKKPPAKKPGEAHADLGYGEGSKKITLNFKQKEQVEGKIAYALQLGPKISDLEKKAKAAKKVLDGHKDELNTYRQSLKDALEAIPLIAEGKYTPPKETTPMKLGG